MNNVLELVKIVGALAGLLALSWNIFVYISSRSGKLEATIGWGTNEDLSTYLYLSVVNKGMDTRTIKQVALVYLDEKPLKNGTHSTENFITELPKKSLKRGEMFTEKIQYQQNPILKELFFRRPILFRVIDTLDCKYDSTRLNDGVFFLPDKK